MRGWVVVLSLEGSTASTCELMFVPTSLLFKRKRKFREITTFIRQVQQTRAS